MILGPDLHTLTSIGMTEVCDGAFLPDVNFARIISVQCGHITESACV